MLREYLYMACSTKSGRCLEDLFCWVVTQFIFTTSIVCVGLATRGREYIRVSNHYFFLGVGVWRF
jgi:hypothetical protein